MGRAAARQRVDHPCVDKLSSQCGRRHRVTDASEIDRDHYRPVIESRRYACAPCSKCRSRFSRADFIHQAATDQRTIWLQRPAMASALSNNKGK